MEKYSEDFTKNFRNGIINHQEAFMALQTLDNLRQASEQLTELLGVNRTMLAGLLGVTERSMSEWEKKSIGNITPKAKRLALLYNLVRFIEQKYPTVPAKMYREILENSRVTIDPNDPEDGSISLMNMVISDPDEKYWPQIAGSAIKEYLEEIGFNLRNEREGNSTIQQQL
jgi:transcriptional regulator with XRE-family HTH domain